MSTDPTRPMTADEVRMALALGGCRFSSGTFDKRFARMTAERAGDPEPTITEKGAACLREKVRTYRRQIPADVVALAGEAPTFAPSPLPGPHVDLAALRALPWSGP